MNSDKVKKVDELLWQKQNSNWTLEWLSNTGESAVWQQVSNAVQILH